MDIGDKQLLEKLLGMLGSDQLGERANAAAFIHRLARKHSLTIVELVRRAFGSAQAQAQARNPHNSFDEARANARAQQAQQAEMARRAAAAEQERLRREMARARAAEQERLREAARARAAQERIILGGGNALLVQLNEVKLAGVLTPWETQFAHDICGRYSYDEQLSDKQRAIVEKILRKTMFARGRG